MRTLSTLKIANNVKTHATQINKAETSLKNLILKNINESLKSHENEILTANAKDIYNEKKQKIAENLIDRLTLNSERIENMRQSITKLITMNDPIGEIIFGRILENGLKLKQIRVPLGVVGVIYEGRPNVTVEAATICLKSGNGVLLRGGSQSIETNKALVKLMKHAIELSGLNSNILGFIENTSRQSAVEVMNLHNVLF